MRGQKPHYLYDKSWALMREVKNITIFLFSLTAPTEIVRRNTEFFGMSIKSALALKNRYCAEVSQSSTCPYVSYRV